jgi:N-acetylglucosamine-6-phosphate deacetylase
MAALCRALAQVGDVDGVLALPPHLEGPFLSVHRLGVHDAAAVAACDPASVLDAARAGAGMVTLAPERPGGLELLQDLARSGVRVSLGHSDATLAQAEAAFAAGAVMVTHVFNAMAPLHHRSPGLAGAALGGAHAPSVGLIADGVHVAPEMCAMVARLVGERLVLVSDAVEQAGSGAGEARDAGGRLAGSTARLDAGVRNLIDWGVDAASAVHAASLAPARVLGLDDRGSLEPGRLAVGVRWDAAWRVVAAGPITELAPLGAAA